MRASWQDISALADAMYAEARGDGSRSMRAVGHTVMNRSLVAGVPVSQAAYANAQFTGLMPNDPNRKAVEQVSLDDPQYARAVELATEIVTGKSLDVTGGATYYHTTTIKPDWSGAKGFDKTKQIGSHQFYTAPEAEVRAVTRQGAVAPVARDATFVADLQAAVGAPVDFETGDFVFSDTAAGQPDGGYDPLSSVSPQAPGAADRSFMAFAGMTPESGKTQRQIDRMTPDGQNLLEQTGTNLERMGELGYEVPDGVTVTSGMRTYETDRRTHPTGTAFDLRTRDMTPAELRSTAMAAAAAGGKGFGIFDGTKDRFDTHMHVDKVGAWGDNRALGSAVPPDMAEAFAGAGVVPTGQKIAEALGAGVVLPEGTLTAAFVQDGVIPAEGPRARPDPEAEPLVADADVGIPDYAELAGTNPFETETTDVAEAPAPTEAPVDIASRIDQGFNVPTGDVVTAPNESWTSATAATPQGPGELPPADTRMVPTQSFPMDDYGARVDQGFDVAEQQAITDRINQGFNVPTGDVVPAPQYGPMAAQAAPAGVPPYDPLLSVTPPPVAVAPVAPAYDPLASVAPPAPPAAPAAAAAPAAPMPMPRPDGLGVVPEVMEDAPVAVPPAAAAPAPVPTARPASPETVIGEVPDVATTPDDVGHLTGDYSMANDGVPTPREKPEPDTTMGNIIGQGFGAVGGGIMGGIPGAMMGRNVGGAIGRTMSGWGLGGWVDDVAKPDPRMERAIEAGWSSPGGDLNSEWDDGRYWSELSKTGYTNNERGMQMAMAREQRERAAAGQKTWADAFGINQDTSAFKAGRDALGSMVDRLTAPIVDPIKENITTPIREAWEDNVTEPIQNNIVQPLKENIVEPIKSGVDRAVSTVTTPVKAAVSTVTTPISSGINAVGDATKAAVEATAAAVSASSPAPPTDPNKEALNDAVDEAASEAEKSSSSTQSTESSSSSDSDSDGGGSGNPNEDGGSDDGGASSRNVDGSIGGLYDVKGTAPTPKTVGKTVPNVASQSRWRRPAVTI